MAESSAQHDAVSQWVKVIALFALAPAAQVAMYAAPLHGPIWEHVPRLGTIADDFVYTILVLLFVFGPAAIAFALSFRMLRGSVRASVVPPLLLLGAGSAYAGVLICLNVWGT